MKKFTCVILVALCFMFKFQVSAEASSIETAGMVSAAGTATAMGVENLYEASVVARMNGRAGASTVNGAKGISFEIIYSDIKNVLDGFKGGMKTKLSASSIDDLADLVTTNKNGEIVQLIQCKDGTSTTQIDNVIKQVSSGKYASAELVGTKEFAEIYNEKAATKGITQKATNSGISTNTTSKVADKALGIAPAKNSVLKSTVKNSGIFAAMAGCISLAESVYRGDDIYTTTGSLVEDTSISTVSVALATVSSAELPAILTAMGVSAAAANTAAAVVAFIVPVAGGYALYVLADECQFEEKVADTMQDVVSVLSGTYEIAGEAVSNFAAKASSWVENLGEQ